MPSSTYYDDATLIVGEQQVDVTADLEAIGPARAREWSGTLHDVPTPLIHQMESGPVRLRLPNGEERRIWPEENTYRHEEETASVPISGDGRPPF
ncbi:hypothetical protein [Streptomyces sp. NPDC051214]|uniref:hypothetical protein n=1 Tax=Streptomyces sp. NPDC051214 TaxID=3155282 RepID=UPI003419FB98